jgi:hypothetical protein
LSPPRSGRGAKPAKPAKPAKSAKVTKPSKPAPAKARGVYVQSPKSDVYVTLLGISLGALLLACLLLFLVYSRYDMKMAPSTAWVGTAINQRV